MVSSVAAKSAYLHDGVWAVRGPVVNCCSKNIPVDLLAGNVEGPVGQRATQNEESQEPPGEKRVAKEIEGEKE